LLRITSAMMERAEFPAPRNNTLKMRSGMADLCYCPSICFTASKIAECSRPWSCSWRAIRLQQHESEDVR
jgi:hypothetical protein